jgi:hypothetical protein
MSAIFCIPTTAPRAGVGLRHIDQQSSPRIAREPERAVNSHRPPPAIGIGSAALMAA